MSVARRANEMILLRMLFRRRAARMPAIVFSQESRVHLASNSRKLRPPEARC
jgi:hypothetical protein